MNLIKKLILILGMVGVGQSMVVASTWLSIKNKIKTLGKATHDVIECNRNIRESFVVALGLTTVMLYFTCDEIIKNPELLKDKQKMKRINGVLAVPALAFSGYFIYKIGQRYKFLHMLNQHTVAMLNHSTVVLPHVVHVGNHENTDEIHYPESKTRYKRHIVQPKHQVPDYKNISLEELQTWRCTTCLNDIDEIKQNENSIGIQMACCKNIAFCSLQELDEYIKKNDRAVCPLCREAMNRFALVNLETGTLLKNTDNGTLECFIAGEDQKDLMYVTDPQDNLNRDIAAEPEIGL